MMQKLLKILAILFVSTIVIFVFGFSAKRNALHKIKSISIKIENDSQLYLTPQTVNKMLIQKSGNINSLSKDALFLNDLERALRTNQLVEKADVFVGINGALGVIIKQKIPIARVLDSTRVFYIDNLGGSMPLSYNFSATVPTISGINTKTDIAEVFKLADFIYKNSFLKGVVIGINKNKDNEYELLTRTDEAVVLIGDLNDLELKTNNFKAYYLNANQRKLNNSYKIINLKYRNQVVCTK